MSTFLYTSYGLVDRATFLGVALRNVLLEVSWADTIVICLIDLLRSHVSGIGDQEPRTSEHKYSDTSMYKADSRPETARVYVVHVWRHELEEPCGQSLAAESE